MVWKNSIQPLEGIAPLNYWIDNAVYKQTHTKQQHQIKKETTEWLESLAEMWGEARGWWISGAITISERLHTYPREHTNTDVALLQQEGLLQYLIEKAAHQGYFLFKKRASFKVWMNSSHKYEIYRPVELQEISLSRKKNRNFQFCKVDTYGNIITANTIQDRIKLYLHHVEDELISNEDDRIINPSFLTNEIIHSTQAGKRIYATSLGYMIDIKKEMAKKKKADPKHAFDLERMLLHSKKGTI